MMVLKLPNEFFNTYFTAIPLINKKQIVQNNIMNDRIIIRH